MATGFIGLEPPWEDENAKEVYHNPMPGSVPVLLLRGRSGDGCGADLFCAGILRS